MSLEVRRRVSVLSLGGTIASTQDPGGAAAGVVPKLGAGDLVAAVPQLADVADVEAQTFRQCASGDLVWSDLVALSVEVRSRLDGGSAGVVVTQGTDTIEETAFALDLLVQHRRPVVVTGAMRNPTLPGADGPANLLAAVQVAASESAAGLGCVVVMNDEIHAARFVRKTHTSSASTFVSTTAGPLGWVVEGRVRAPLQPVALPPITGVAEPVPPVALLAVAVGDDARLVDQLETLGYAGAVVEALGGGHVPSGMVSSLERLAERMPVVLASRTGGGEVLRDTYGFPGSERDLIGRGLVPSGSLDGRKARVLLSLLLAGGAGRAEVETAFSQR
ncbi:MAG: asparaginase [Actinomycetota bacterium]|nr:asparaginase [Actinomycetota bacterium]